MGNTKQAAMLNYGIDSKNLKKRPGVLTKATHMPNFKRICETVLSEMASKFSHTNQ